MFEKEITETLSTLLSERRFSEIKEFLREFNEVDIAEILAELKEEDAVKIFRIIPKEPAAEIFASMDSDLQESVISAITDRELHNILNELFVDDTVDLLEEMPANVVNRILKHTDAETRKAINQLLRYHEDSAGSLMNTEFIDLKKEMTVKGAIVHIRRFGDSVEDISSFYVTERDRVLIGTLSLKDIILANEDTLIGDIMDERVVFCHTGDDKEEVASMFTKYGLLDRIELRLANGLLGLKPNEVEAVTILGMGGETIIRIIDNAPVVKNVGVRLLLQPMTDFAMLRNYLAQNGFDFVDEDVVESDGRMYQCIVAEYSGKCTELTPAEADLGAVAIKNNSECFVKYVKHRYDVVKKRRDGKLIANADVSEENILLEEYNKILIANKA